MEIEGKKQINLSKIMKTRKKLKRGEENYLPSSDYEESSSESIQSDIELPESPPKSPKSKHRPEEYKNQLTSLPQSLNPDFNNKGTGSHETNLNICLNVKK